MPQYFTVGQVADQLGVPPRKISDLFYSRILDNTRCKMLLNRRHIPSDYLPEIHRVLAERGCLPPERDSVASA